MMKQQTLLLLALLLGTGSMTAENLQATSPDGRLVVDIAVENGQATYAVSYDSRPMLLPLSLIHISEPTSPY